MSKKQFGFGDAPIEDKYHRKMNALARTLDEWFNGDAKGKDRRVSAFVLDMKSEGVEVESFAPEAKMGMPTSNTGMFSMHMRTFVCACRAI